MEPAAGAPVVPGYALTRLLGRGAGGEVWAARELASGALVAVKLADPTTSPPGQLRALAAREVAVLDRVSSDHVLRLRATATLPTGGVALVLDLAEGGSLAALVAGRGRLADGEVVTICTALATALAALHETGVIHGDLAAGNVLFTGEGKPLIADFATARLVGESDPPLVAGTAGFVAPEVARGDIPTEASDAYGLGALAWFALTGRPRTTDEEPDRAEAVGFLGRRLGPVVAPLLATNPAARPGLRAAAANFYRAASAVPVTLDGAGDPAAALTRRIRAQAKEPEPPSPPARASPERGPWRRRLTSSRAPWPQRLHGTALRMGLGRRALRPASLGRARRWRARVGGAARRRALLVVAALLAATAAVLAVSTLPALLSRQPPVPMASADPSARAPAATPPDGSVLPGAPGIPGTGGAPGAPDAGPVRGPSPTEALRTNPAAVLSALADARAGALMSGEPPQLLRAAAADSPMHHSDAALLATLAESQTRYADLAFFVRAAELRGGAHEGEALVRAVVDRSGYRVLGPGSAQRSVPAEAGAAYVYRLVLVGGQWRLAEIT